MIQDGRLPNRGGQWIDTYSQVTNPTIAGTIIAGILQKNHYYVMVQEQSAYKVRKLTPRECFRLMDVQDEDIDVLLDAGISDTQLTHLAGNSIVVSCLYHIFDKLFIHPDQAGQTLL